MSSLKSSTSPLDRLFDLKGQGTTARREMLAGLTTFFTLAYSIILVPTLLSQAGMDFGAVMVATLLVGAYSSLVMGLLANYPFILAPGIALCVYFTYSVVQAQGIAWEVALGFVFLAGILLLFLNLTHIRKLIIQAIPLSLRLATTAGLGFFLALIALKNAGIIEAHPKTFLAFADPRSHAHLMTCIGIILMATMMRYRIPGAIFLGIVAIWLISLLFGFVKFQGLVSWPSSLTPTFFALDVKSAFDVRYIGVVISFLFVALFDSTGTLIALAEEGNYLEECSKKYCHFPRISRALMPDATGSILSGFLGSSSVAVYLESVAGIEVGGRTGLCAVTCGVMFLLALFFAPFASSIPLFATAPALLIISALMLKKLALLEWEDPTEWVPAFITFVLIPLTYSVANGIAAGYIVYCFIKLLSGRVADVHWLSWILAVLFIAKFVFLP